MQTLLEGKHRHGTLTWEFVCNNSLLHSTNLLDLCVQVHLFDFHLILFYLPSGTRWNCNGLQKGNEIALKKS